MQYVNLIFLIATLHAQVYRRGFDNALPRPFSMLTNLLVAHPSLLFASTQQPACWPLLPLYLYTVVTVPSPAVFRTLPQPKAKAGVSILGSIPSLPTNSKPIRTTNAANH